MKFRKLRRTIQRDVGVVIDRDTVIGEWSGTRWEDIPPKARLYVNRAYDMRVKYEAGELTARRWTRSHRHYGHITGWEYTSAHGHTNVIYNLRDDFPDCTPDELLTAIVGFADYARQLDANVGSSVGTIASIVNASLPHDVITSERELPLGNIWRGARIERTKRMQHEFHNATLWDITSAYPSHLIGAAIPKKWFHYDAEPHATMPDVPTGFARALVFIPPEVTYGPLPDTNYLNPVRMLFPVDDALAGVWSFDELRAAQNAGCTITLLEFWVGKKYVHPFDEFGQLYVDMRLSLSPLARRLAKRGAVGYVGTLARDGRQKRSRWIDGAEQVWEVGGECLPPARGLHGLVTSAVRAQLYDEGIRPYSDEFVSCHTDGVILLDDARTWPLFPSARYTKLPGDWADKRRMQTLYSFDAQRYAYIDEDGTLRHSVAGVPEDKVERWLDRKINGHSFRSRIRPERPTSMIG